MMRPFPGAMRVDRTPVDCLISELRDEFEAGGVLSRARFEARVAQFEEEVAVDGGAVAKS